MRREVSKIIINKSNRGYNQNVLKENCGNPITVKNTKQKPNVFTHVICSICGGLVTNKYFPSHKVTCEKRQLLVGNNETEIPTSKLMTCDIGKKYKVLETKVLSTMKMDPIRVHIQKDPLILEFRR